MTRIITASPLPSSWQLASQLMMLALLSATSACSSSDSYRGMSLETTAAPKTAAEMRAELLGEEQSSPGDYLKVTGTYRRNLIDQLVLEGDIKNTASLATFKDPILIVDWISKTNTVIDTKQYRVYELVRHGHSVHFKLKTDAPEEVVTVSMGSNDAVAVD
jgi:hypothetical protein